MDNTQEQQQSSDTNSEQAQQTADWFTFKEFLNFSGLSYSTVRKLRKQGRGPKIIQLGTKTLRVHKKDAKEWVEHLRETISQKS